tara:strand:- start:4001 stop:5350 length:1350 start_codon:yes stop_codon:yes gene_type:complete
MPFNNYAPQYIFKGQVQSDTAPSQNNDLVRKQDVSGLSFISSIASGSSSYLSVDASGELSVDSLLISDVTVNGTETSLANFISNESSAAAALKKGDFLVLTAATGGAETYIVSGANGSTAGNYTQVESGLTSAEIVAHLTGGTGINIAANGTISFNGDTDDVSEGSTNLYYTDARFNTAFGGKSTSDLSEGSNLYYTDARSRAAISATGNISYNNSTGVISTTLTQYTDSDARGAFGYGQGIDIAIDGTLSLDFTEFDTDDLVEGSSNLFYTDARARGAFSAGTGITISGAGEIASSITQYTDSNARAAVSGGDGLDYNSSTGVFSLDLKANSGLAIDAGELKVELGEGLGFAPDGVIEVEAGDGLEINSGDQSLQVDKAYFRKVLSAQSFTANSAKTINHALGEKYVQVSVYDSSDNLVHAEVSLTDANNLTITMSDALTGVTIVVSI